jgi:two-component system KDP operon response regulator KdpE
MSKIRILITGDEPVLLERIRQLLTSSDYEVEVAVDEKGASLYITQLNPDLIVLDVDFENTKINGFEVCKNLRRKTLCPIVALSLYENDENWIMALIKCADNYISRPFSNEYLLAVVHNSLRLWLAAKKRIKLPEQAIQHGDFFINPDTRRVTINSKHIHFTPTEFDLLYYLAMHYSRALSTQELIKVISRDGSRDTNNLRGFISKIRKKIENDPAKPQYILTINGFGYRFNSLL